MTNLPILDTEFIPNNRIVVLAHAREMESRRTAIRDGYPLPHTEEYWKGCRDALLALIGAKMGELK